MKERERVTLLKHNKTSKNKIIFTSTSLIIKHRSRSLVSCPKPLADEPNNSKDAPNNQ